MSGRVAEDANVPIRRVVRIQRNQRFIIVSSNIYAKVPSKAGALEVEYLQGGLETSTRCASGEQVFKTGNLAVSVLDLGMASSVGCECAYLGFWN